MFSEKEYTDFILRLEYRLSAGANSGVLLRTPICESPASNSIEVQIIDDSSPSYARLPPWQSNGALWGLVAPQEAPGKPPGQWNSLEITCQGRKIRVTLNGKTVMDADLDYAARKPLDGRDHPGVKRDKGHIGFIGRGSTNRVEYRNIRIRPW